MQDIEQKISPLIENMFPSFYKDEGQNFITFVKAYYEWLETNHQLIQLEDNTNFNVGDTVTQDIVTGTIVTFVGTDILVKVNGLETFKCFNICSELIPITSSSGGDTYILRGGATKRLGSIFLSRNLPNIRDIDTTLDLFITQFKEKYLKNIEFDTQSNKRMLVKNSLDLYRSKGTSRSIDLFFRLVYGYNSQVVYPGENLFKLSEGTWVQPRYLEITGSNPQRAVTLVGTLIRGISSGAEAFVEKYIKRKVNNGFVHILYLSNVQGEFINNETLYRKSDKTYSDSPRVLGSLTAVDVLTGSKDFAVGDIVSFTTEGGDYGQARVSAVYNDERGVVDFILIDGGYGYSVSHDITGIEANNRTQSLITDYTIQVSNVQTSNSISDVNVLVAGSGYSNSDVITIRSSYGNAKLRPVTNTSGAIRNVALMTQSGGFFGNEYQVQITTSGGAGASLQPIFKEAYLSNYYKTFEDLRQNRATIEYTGIADGTKFAVGDVISISKSNVRVANAEIIENRANIYSNGEIVMVVSSNYNVAVGDKIYQPSNVQIIATVGTKTDSSALGRILDVSATGTMNIINSVGVFSKYDEIYQFNNEGVVIGRAKIDDISLNTTNGTLTLSNMTGIFKTGLPILVSGKKNSTAIVTKVNLFVSVYNTKNRYDTSKLSKLVGSQTGTIADVEVISGGVGASFKVGKITEAETIQVNSDLLSSNNNPTAGANQSFLSLPLNSTAFGFKQRPSGNVSSSIFSCLSFANLSIGTISTLSDLNPGDNYATSPVVKAYQPYVISYIYNDYVFTVKDASNQYIIDEQVTQTFADLRYSMEVSNAQSFRVGEKIYQNTTGAVGTVFAVEYPTSNVIVVNKVSNGIFTASGGPSKNLFSYSTSTSTTNVISVASYSNTVIAKGQVISVSGNTVYVKRQQFENNFQLNKILTGKSTGVTANLIQIEEYARQPIGFNAQIDALAYGADGVITNLQVVDSGYGYSNNQTLVYTSEDGTRTGTARAIVSGSGTGSGYYKTSKGFLSNISKVHDGDYYQEYSYDVMSRLPLDKYVDMFKKVMHVSGTRLFGTVVIDTVSNNIIRIANSSFEVIPASPLSIQDRSSVYIMDRGNLGSSNFIDTRG
jgi:hypothetical protein